MKNRTASHKPARSAAPGVTRRTFLGGLSAATAFTIVAPHVLGGEGHIAPSDKTTLAGIGVGGQGSQNIQAFLEFPEIQVVAVCDVNREGGGYLSWNWTQGKEQRTAGREPARRMVDETYAKDKPAGTSQGCRAYSDFRELLAKEDVDAVMVATPDHTHAVITMAALKKGKHVYCEKPLTYSVYEARQVAEAARKAGVATQLGNQGQASEEARLVCEFIWDGAIGGVHEVQVWSPARFWAWPAGEGRPPETPPVPDGLDWDLWLGPAPQRPYHPAYHPWTWRNWWDFGTGLLGDLGCHKLSTVFKALKLGHPTSIEASSTKLNPEIYPLGVTGPVRVSRPRRHAAGDAQLVRRRTETAFPERPGAQSRHGRRDLPGRQGHADEPPDHPRNQDAGLRQAAETAGTFGGALQGIRRCLPRRRAGGCEFRRPCRAADRGLHAGQRRPAGRQEAGLGRPELPRHQRRGRQRTAAPRIPGRVDVVTRTGERRA